MHRIKKLLELNLFCLVFILFFVQTTYTLEQCFSFFNSCEQQVIERIYDNVNDGQQYFVYPNQLIEQGMNIQNGEMLKVWIVDLQEQMNLVFTFDQPSDTGTGYLGYVYGGGVGSLQEGMVIAFGYSQSQDCKPGRGYYSCHCLEGKFEYINKDYIGEECKRPLIPDNGCGVKLNFIYAYEDVFDLTITYPGAIESPQFIEIAQIVLGQGIYVIVLEENAQTLKVQLKEVRNFETGTSQTEVDNLLQYLTDNSIQPIIMFTNRNFKQYLTQDNLNTFALQYGWENVVYEQLEDFQTIVAYNGITDTGYDASQQRFVYDKGPRNSRMDFQYYFTQYMIEVCYAPVCDQYSYMDINTNMCTTCLQKCETCFQESECSSCAVGNNRTMKIPECGCVFGYYENGVDCVQCQLKCETCNEQNVCLTCRNTPNRMTVDPCNCENGYWEVSIDECRQCQEPCKNCLDQTVCESCIDTYYFKDNSCLLCEHPCINCVLNDQLQVVCTSCVLGDNRNTEPPCQCLDSFYDDQGQCVSCSTTCKTCQTQNECSSCIEGQYLDSVIKTCKLCVEPCINCESETACLSCIDGYYYQDFDKSCQLCYSPCVNCEQFGSVCLSCVVQEKRHQEPPCQCFDGFYGNECQYDCPSMCKTCDRSDNCTSCPDQFYLEWEMIGGGNPDDPNDFGYSYQVCNQCQVLNCKTCTFQNNCQECMPGYYALNDQCFACIAPCVTCLSDTWCSSCVQGQYAMNGFCQDCNSKCETCDQDLICLTCKQNLNRQQNNECTCINGFYDAGQDLCIECSCQLCINDQNCQECNISGQQLNFCSCDSAVFNINESNPIDIICTKINNSSGGETGSETGGETGSQTGGEDPNNGQTTDGEDTTKTDNVGRLNETANELILEGELIEKTKQQVVIENYGETVTTTTLVLMIPLVMSGSSSLLVNLIDYTQMLAQMVSLKINQHKTIEDFLKIFTSFSYPFLPNAFEYVGLLKIEGKYNELPAKFKEHEINSSFFINYGQIMSINCIAVFYYFLFKFAYSSLKGRDDLSSRGRKMRYYFHKILLRIEYNIFIELLYLIYMVGIWAGFLHLKSFQLKTDLDYIELFCCIVCLVIHILVPIKMYKSVKFYSETRQERYRQQYDSVWDLLNLQKLRQMQFWVIFLYRKVFFTFAIVFLHDYLTAQIIIMVAYNIILLGNMVVYNVYEDYRDTLCEGYSELLFIPIQLLFLFQCDEDKCDTDDDFILVLFLSQLSFYFILLVVCVWEEFMRTFCNKYLYRRRRKGITQEKLEQQLEKLEKTDFMKKFREQQKLVGGKQILKQEFRTDNPKQQIISDSNLNTMENLQTQDDLLQDQGNNLNKINSGSNFLLSNKNSTQSIKQRLFQSRGGAQVHNYNTNDQQYQDYEQQIQYNKSQFQQYNQLQQNINDNIYYKNQNSNFNNDIQQNSEISRNGTQTKRFFIPSNTIQIEKTVDTINNNEDQNYVKSNNNNIDIHDQLNNNNSQILYVDTETGQKKVLQEKINLNAKQSKIRQKKNFNLNKQQIDLLGQDELLDNSQNQQNNTYDMQQFPKLNDNLTQNKDNDSRINLQQQQKNKYQHYIQNNQDINGSLQDLDTQNQIKLFQSLNQSMEQQKIKQNYKLSGDNLLQQSQLYMQQQQQNNNNLQENKFNLLNQDHNTNITISHYNDDINNSNNDNNNQDDNLNNHQYNIDNKNDTNSQNDNNDNNFKHCNISNDTSRKSNDINNENILNSGKVLNDKSSNSQNENNDQSQTKSKTNSDSIKQQEIIEQKTLKNNINTQFQNNTSQNKINEFNSYINNANNINQINDLFNNNNDISNIDKNSQFSEVNYNKTNDNTKRNDQNQFNKDQLFSEILQDNNNNQEQINNQKNNNTIVSDKQNKQISNDDNKTNNDNDQDLNNDSHNSEKNENYNSDKNEQISEHNQKDNIFNNYNNKNNQNENISDKNDSSRDNNHENHNNNSINDYNNDAQSSNDKQKNQNQSENQIQNGINNSSIQQSFGLNQQNNDNFSQESDSNEIEKDIDTNNSKNFINNENKNNKNNLNNDKYNNLQNQQQENQIQNQQISKNNELLEKRKRIMELKKKQLENRKKQLQFQIENSQKNQE